MSSRVVRIDPGTPGAVAVLGVGGELLEVLDMPSTPEAKGRPAPDVPLLAGIPAHTQARIALCEFLGAFAFGRARGVIEGCAGALGLPIVFLTPPTWKRLAENSAWCREQGPGSQQSNPPLPGPGRIICPQVRHRPRRGCPSRLRWHHAGGPRQCLITPPNMSLSPTCSTRTVTTPSSNSRIEQFPCGSRSARHLTAESTRPSRLYCRQIRVLTLGAFETVKALGAGDKAGAA